MKTRVILTSEDDQPRFILFKKDEPRWKIGDEGYIDGYVCDQHGATYACVVINYIIVKVPLHYLKVKN
jgi:hypothetical protein